MTQKLPNTIILGAQKAGTTSLFDWLGQHPDIFAHPGMKDYDFFINDEIYDQGLDWFAKAFSEARHEPIILHGHVNYIYFPVAAKRLYDYNPSLKMILVVRNPVDRAYSAYWDARKVAREPLKSFEEALAWEEKRKTGSLNEQGMLTYLSHGLYAQQLKEYLKLFPLSQFKIIRFEDLVQKKEETIRECFRFLEVDEQFLPDFRTKNESGMPRSILLQKFFQSLKMPRPLKKFIPPHITSHLKSYLIRNLNVKKQKYPPLSSDTRQRLLKYFKEDIEELENITGLDFTEWKK